MEINIQDEKMAFENAWLVPHELEFFDFDLKKNQYLLKEQYVSDDESPIANETYHSINSGWSMWLKAKAHEAEKLNGCVVVPESELETCYYDEYEGMYLTNHDFLKNIDVGEAVEVKRQYFWETKSLFAAITWDEVNKKEGSFQLFNSHDEADKAASHCKAMLEAAMGGNDE